MAGQAERMRRRKKAAIYAVREKNGKKVGAVGAIHVDVVKK